MAKDNHMKLGELLLTYNLIDQEQLENAIEKQQNSDKRLGEVLVDLDYVSEQDLIEALEFQLGVPHVNLDNYILNPHLSTYVPESMAKRYKAVPLEKSKNNLLMAMVDPTDLLAIDDIEMTSGLKVEPRIATGKAISKAISKIYSPDEEETDEIFASLDDYQIKTREEEPEIDDLREMVDDAPIVRLANLIISQAIQAGASDIHIEPQEKEMRVRYRIDGVLRQQMTVPKYSQAALISRFKIIADLDITQRRIPQDGRVEMDANGQKIDMRVSTLPTVFGEKIVIRILDKDDSLINLDKLGFSEQNYQNFMELIENPHGIILVTGPTGSGKSTTLIAALNHLNDVEQNLVTIEDPVEYQLVGINQVQANPKAGLSFAKVLRSILRQDPDIVMVGEIRDEETAQIAVRAALTGHLVLSTLHTNDAVSSITRLIDMGVPPYLVASTVVGVVAQRLVRRLCKSCREKYIPEIQERTALGIDENEVLYRARGCKKCNLTGYRGRMAVHEILMVDQGIKELIINGANEQEIKQLARKHGMKTLKEDGLVKVENHYTSYEELIRVII
ncbi:MAG: type II secretion system ATPase GspE [Halothermotrichaceae bacterium]